MEVNLTPPLFPVGKEKASGDSVPYGVGSKPRPMGGDSLLSVGAASSREKSWQMPLLQYPGMDAAPK